VGGRPLNEVLDVMDVALQPEVIRGLGDRIMKVNHAGENGAVNIYRGQIFLAKLTAPKLVEELREFQAHEKQHRAIFAAELERRSHPRCRSYLLCGLGGLVLGFLTGLFGRNAIAATTVAVESVVLRHLREQMDILDGVDESARLAITSIVAEETQHRDDSAQHLDTAGFWARVLTPIVSISTEAVIWTGMRL
jgi:ubiquinone biosynthesis monooxygenase Coq7